jgi:hypothetical protein
LADHRPQAHAAGYGCIEGLNETLQDVRPQYYSVCGLEKCVMTQVIWETSSKKSILNTKNIKCTLRRIWSQQYFVRYYIFLYSKCCIINICNCTALSNYYEFVK